MFLEKVEIHQWRGLKKLQLQFKPGLNLLHGPNESGKSSLHDALRAAFLRKSRGKGSPTEAKPWSGSGVTSVAVHFSHLGQPWRLTKVFFGHGSHLYAGDKLLAKDDAVQTWLDENLADRGLAALLSVQGDIKLADVPPAMRSHLVAAETVTPGVAWLEAELQEKYETFWTPKTGGAKKILLDSRRAALDAEKAVEGVKDELKSSLRAAQEMESLQKDSQESKQAQQVLLARLEQQRPLLGAWESYRRQQAELASLQQQEKSMQGWLQRWDEHNQRARLLGPQLEQWKTARTALEQKLATPPDRAPIEALQLRLQYGQARQHFLVSEELAKLAAPTREQVKQLEELSQRLQALEQSLHAGAWEARLEALQDLSASLDGQPLQLARGHQQTWKTAQGFTLELAGARLQLKAGGQTVEQVEQCRQQLADLLQQGQLSSPAQAREKLEQAQDLKARLKGANPDLTALRLRYAESGQLDALSSSQLDSEVTALPQRIVAAEKEWKQANDDHSSHQKELQKLLKENPEIQMQSSLDALRGQAAERPELGLSVTQEVPAPAALDPLRQQLSELRAKIQSTSLSAPEGAEVSPASIQALEAQLTASQGELEHQQQRLNQLIGGVKEQKNLYERLCQAEENLARAHQELAKVELAAHSIRLLWESFQSARKDLDRDIVAPLRKRLSARIYNLTQARYQQVVMEHDFKAESLLTADGQTAPLIDLSFGTREQLAFLSRLCLAEMLSEKERNLVVFDDNLVHTDPERLQLACAMLEEAAQKSQVLLLTCHPESFLRLLPHAHVQELGK